MCSSEKNRLEQKKKELVRPHVVLCHCKAWIDRIQEDILAICPLSFCSPMPVLFRGDPREAEVCWEWFLVLESSTELLLPGPEAKVSIFSCNFRIFAACPQGSLSRPSCAVRSGFRARSWSFCPTGAEVGRELLAGSEVGMGWLAPGMAVPLPVLPLHQNSPFQLLKQELWGPEVISSLPALTRNWVCTPQSKYPWSD